MPPTFYMIAFTVGLVSGYLAARFDNYQPIPILVGFVFGIIVLYQLIVVLPVGIVFPVLIWTTITTCVGVAISYSITNKPRS